MTAEEAKQLQMGASDYVEMHNKLKDTLHIYTKLQSCTVWYTKLFYEYFILSFLSSLQEFGVGFWHVCAKVSESIHV